MKQIKMVLVNPSNKFLSNVFMSEPLGLMYLEGVLKNIGVDVQIVDMSFTSTLPEADIYGFSASSIHYQQCVEYARKTNGAYTVIGGPHVSVLPGDALKYFHAVVMGPGEKAIVDVINDFKHEKKGGVFFGNIENIDAIPIPPRTIMNTINYNVFPNVDKSASIITSRGCPYTCSFCSSNAIWGRKVLYHSIDRVMKEIQYLKETYNINHFKFVDDIFTLNKPRFKEFAKALSNLNIKWLCESRIDALDDEILDEMMKNGCTHIDIGAESANDMVLEKIHKKQIVSKVKNAIRKIKSKGLKVKTYFIYGLPFEPENIVQQTIDFIEETNPDYVSLFTLVPYPGTDIWKHPEQYNIKEINKDFNKYQHSVGNTPEELEWLPVVEYNDRTREKMREERNTLKKYIMERNKRKA